MDFVSSKLKRELLKISADPILSQRITVFFRMLSACGSPNGNGWDTRKMLWLRRMQGYSCILPDGTKGFRCGYDMIPLPGFGAEQVPEAKKALRLQHELFLRLAGA